MRGRLLLLAVILSSCGGQNSVVLNPGPGGGSPPPTTQDWLIPKNQVFDGGPGRDGIPALENPEKIPAEEAGYLLEQEFVLGFYDGNQAIAYPHSIMDWHEIVNETINNKLLAITYCPLTGTGIGWDRESYGQESTFGVSGLLYNNNLIAFDRNTNSNWAQLTLMSVNGPLIGTEMGTFPLVETRWGVWKAMFPDTRVVSRNTGVARSYGTYPYGDWKTNEDALFFPVVPDDRRLNRKERVHGVLIDGKAKVYRFGSFQTTNTLIADTFNGADIMIIGNSDNFIVSFFQVLADGSRPVFTAVDENNVILTDNEGNSWDIFGYAVSGPRLGEQLIPTQSFMGYWFAFGSFYPTPEIFDF